LSKGNPGKLFEKQFKDSIPEGVYYYRIQDSASGWSFSSSASNNVRFTPKNHFDCMLYKTGVLFLLELKSTKSTSISFRGTSPMIKQHQIDELNKAAKNAGIIAGFMFDYREANQTFFLSIDNFKRFTNETIKSSININDVISYGGIEVKKELKRTNYRYFVSEFIDIFLNSNIISSNSPNSKN